MKNLEMSQLKMTGSGWLSILKPLISPEIVTEAANTLAPVNFISRQSYNRAAAYVKEPASYLI